ncbi:hypothetical protein [Synechococcus elongatus]|uniref:hypothetical protein n=1 Tax=Synechococcus elongatus TaxID=32046 RepID=UPI0030D2CE0A
MNEINLSTVQARAIGEGFTYLAKRISKAKLNDAISTLLKDSEKIGDGIASAPTEFLVYLIEQDLLTYEELESIGDAYQNQEESEDYSESNRILRVLVKNPKCDSNLIEAILETDRFYVEELHSEFYDESDIDSSNETINELNKYESAKSTKLIIEILDHPQCTIKGILTLAKKARRFRRKVIATHPNVPTEVLWVMTRDEEIEVFNQIVLNPNCTEALKAWLEQCKNYSSSWERNGIAHSLNCPTNLLTQFSNSLDPIDRRSVAANPRCPPEVLSHLSKDRYDFVRIEVARNSETPIKHLWALTSDPSLLVANSIADNPNCPQTLSEWIKQYKQEE